MRDWRAQDQSSQSGGAKGGRRTGACTGWGQLSDLCLKLRQRHDKWCAYARAGSVVDWPLATKPSWQYHELDNTGRRHCWLEPPATTIPSVPATPTAATGREWPDTFVTYVLPTGSKTHGCPISTSPAHCTGSCLPKTAAAGAGYDDVSTPTETCAANASAPIKTTGSCLNTHDTSSPYHQLSNTTGPTATSVCSFPDCRHKHTSSASSQREFIPAGGDSRSRRGFCYHIQIRTNNYAGAALICITFTCTHFCTACAAHSRQDFTATSKGARHFSCPSGCCHDGKSCARHASTTSGCASPGPQACTRSSLDRGPPKPCSICQVAAGQCAKDIRYG